MIIRILASYMVRGQTLFSRRGIIVFSISTPARNRADQVRPGAYSYRILIIICEVLNLLIAHLIMVNNYIW